MKKLTPNLIVDDIESSLLFWVGRVGFTRTVEVPHEGKLGFVILQLGPVELMLQSRASLHGDVAPLAEGPYRSVLYCVVDDLEPVRKALEGVQLVVPERTTFYGARELIVKDPAGNLVFFSSHAGEPDQSG
jgi:catechol 2,3-dioxygenase-like lactoylglutathione lyase family enzyme